MTIPSEKPENPVIGNDERQVQLFAKQMLKGRLFIGTFIEQRRVDSLNCYRHVVSISSKEEQLLQDLQVVLKRLKGFYDSKVWIGITTPDVIGAPAQYCLWSHLPDEVFGTYWYQIYRIRFSGDEIMVRLKTVRILESAVYSEILTSAAAADTSSAANTTKIDTLQGSVNMSLNNTKEFIQENTSYFLKNIATVNNLVEMCKFLVILTATMVTGLVQLTKHLGEFSLKLIHEISFFVNCASPIVIACINMVGKVIGGFYLLIAMMWRDSRGPPPPANYRQYIDQPQYIRSYRALPSSRSNVKIVEVE